MSWVAPHLVGRIPIAALANPPALVELFAETITEELDFRLEADNMLEIAHAFALLGQRGYVIPRPHPSLVTRRVLVMERLRGFAFEDVAGMKDAGVDTHEVVRTGMIGGMEGALIHGIFHGDLHGGNLFVMADGRTALMDFGIVGRLSEPKRQALLRLLIAGSMNDVHGQLGALRDLGALPADTDLDAIIDDLGLDRPPVDPTTMTGDELVGEIQRTIKALLGIGARLPKELMLFVKNMMFLDGAIATLAPDLDIFGEIANISMHFANTYGEQIAAELGLDPGRVAARHDGREGQLRPRRLRREADLPRAAGAPRRHPPTSGESTPPTPLATQPFRRAEAGPYRVRSARKQRAGRVGRRGQRWSVGDWVGRGTRAASPSSAAPPSGCRPRKRVRGASRSRWNAASTTSTSRRSTATRRRQSVRRSPRCVTGCSSPPRRCGRIRTVSSTSSTRAAGCSAVTSSTCTRPTGSPRSKSSTTGPRASSASSQLRDEGRCRFAGITGHDLSVPRTFLEALRRYDLDTVMFPVYPRLWADPVYREAAEELLALCTERDLGVMVIKAVARRPWPDRRPLADVIAGDPATAERWATSWYEPQQDDDAIARGVSFALSTPGVHAFCTPGDLGLLPRVSTPPNGSPPWLPTSGAEAADAMADEDVIFPIPR